MTNNNRIKYDLEESVCSRHITEPEVCSRIARISDAHRAERRQAYRVSRLGM